MTEMIAYERLVTVNDILGGFGGVAIELHSTHTPPMLYTVLDEIKTAAADSFHGNARWFSSLSQIRDWLVESTKPANSERGPLWRWGRGSSFTNDHINLNELFDLASRRIWERAIGSERKAVSLQFKASSVDIDNLREIFAIHPDGSISVTKNITDQEALKILDVLVNMYPVIMDTSTVKAILGARTKIRVVANERETETA